jgi:hypothetical protein
LRIARSKLTTPDYSPVIRAHVAEGTTFLISRRVACQALHRGPVLRLIVFLKIRNRERFAVADPSDDSTKFRYRLSFWLRVWFRACITQRPKGGQECRPTYAPNAEQP